MNHPLFFFILATLLTCLGFLCLHWQRHFTRWAVDRQLDRIAGVLWGWAFVAAALGVAMGVAS